MTELLILTFALEAWAEGNSQALMAMMGLQLAAFAGAVGTWVATPVQVLAHAHLGHIGGAQTVVAEQI